MCMCFATKVLFSHTYYNCQGFNSKPKRLSYSIVAQSVSSSYPYKDISICMCVGVQLLVVIVPTCVRNYVYTGLSQTLATSVTKQCQ